MFFRCSSRLFSFSLNFAFVSSVSTAAFSSFFFAMSFRPLRLLSILSLINRNMRFLQLLQFLLFIDQLHNDRQIIRI